MLAWPLDPKGRFTDTSMQPEEKTSLTPYEAFKAGLALLVVALCGGLRRARREPQWLETTEIALSIADLAKGWAGARVVFLTDIHARQAEGPGRLERIVAAAGAAGGDVIVIGGDTGVCGRVPDYLAGGLRGLSAPLGVWAVLGNHDYPQPERLIALYESAGIETLVNEHRMLTRGGDSLCLAGLDDRRKGAPDPAGALAGVDADCPRLVISHNPDRADEVPDGVRVDAMLSGHTHAGQVRLWRWGPIVVPVVNRAYTGGMADGPGFPVYVSRGLGTCGMTLRFHCAPEVAVFTLMPKSRQLG